jgi:hypothetical protein
LAAGAGGAARYFADAAGLGQEAAAHLQAAVIVACEEAFDASNSGQTTLSVTLTRRTDRIEISVVHGQSASRSRGVDQRAAARATLRADQKAARVTESFEGVDQIQHDIQNGMAITRLTKFIKQGAARR